MTTAIALTVAGSDSGGGAGIQADLKTFSALGVYGASVLTALTAQNTREVRAIFDVSPDFVTQQIDTVFDDLAVCAVKVGMLSRPEIIEAVAAGMTRYGVENLVVDPVMVAKSGDALLRPEAVDALRGRPVFLEIAEKNKNFHYYPALSDKDPDWEGDRGFIHLVMEEYLKDASNAEAYLCGPPIMIDAVTEVLKEKGVPEERILYSILPAAF